MVSEECYERPQKIAEKEDRSVSSVVARAVKKYLEEGEMPDASPKPRPASNGFNQAASYRRP